MPTSTQVQLVVEDFGGDPAAITRLLGLEPTALASPETLGAANSSQDTSWIFAVSMPETESVEGQALALLRFLEVHAEAIRKTIASYRGSIAIDLSGPGPASADALNLVPLVAAEISRLGLGLRVHFADRVERREA